MYKYLWVTESCDNQVVSGGTQLNHDHLHQYDQVMVNFQIQKYPLDVNCCSKPHRLLH